VRHHTVVPATHTLIREWNEPSCLYSPAVQCIIVLRPVLISRLTEGRTVGGWVGLGGWFHTAVFMPARRRSPIPAAAGIELATIESQVQRQPNHPMWISNWLTYCVNCLTQWQILLESYSEYYAGLPRALRLAKQLARQNKLVSLLEVCNVRFISLFTVCNWILRFLYLAFYGRLYVLHAMSIKWHLWSLTYTKRGGGSGATRDMRGNISMFIILWGNCRHRTVTILLNSFTLF